MTTESKIKLAYILWTHWIDKEIMDNIIQDYFVEELQEEQTIEPPVHPLQEVDYNVKYNNIW